MLLHPVAGLAVLAAILSAATAHAQQFPTRPIRLVTGSAGGSLDLTARVLAPELLASMGQPVIVDNRGFALAPPTVANATPDGYTLLLYGSPFWLAPFLQDHVSFDPVKDFAPITMAVTSPNVLVVHPSVSANSVKELIALAKASPGKLNYAASSPGSADQLAAELFKSMAGVNIVSVPYKGASQALNAVIAGEVQIEFVNAATVVPHMKTGRLKALAVGTAQPTQLVPGLPTIAAAGLPGFEASTDLAVFVAARTPAAIVALLNREFVRALRQPAVKEKLFNAGVEAIGSTAQELAAGLKTRMTVFGKIIKDAGIRAG